MTVEKCNEKGYHTGRFTDETETENKLRNLRVLCI